MDKKVSIIVPIYNCENILSKCIDSILNQTYRDLEILLVNDGSSDGSLNVIKEYAKADNRIKLIDKKNGGAASARNTGIENATGKYIMFVDSDDWIELNFVQDLEDILVSSNSDIVKAFYKKHMGKNIQVEDMGIGTSMLEVKKEDFKKHIYPLLINTCVLNAPWAQLIKTSLIKDNNLKFEENLKYGEDQIFNYELYTAAKKVVLVNKPYYNYIYTSGSITTSKGLEKTKERCLSSINNYSRLYDYIKLWDMNDDKTLSIVAARVLREFTNRTKEAFALLKYGVSKTEIYDFTQEMWNNEKVKESISINGKNKYGMQGIENKLYESAIRKSNIDRYIELGLAVGKVKDIVKKIVKR